MNVPSLPVSELYLRCPTLEYSLAFDLALQSFFHDRGPILAVLSSAVHAVELIKRVQAHLSLLGTGSFDPVSFTAEAQSWAWGPLQVAAPGQLFRCAIWAEPEVGSAREMLQTLQLRLAPGSPVAILASAPLYRYLPAWQTVAKPAAHPLLASQVRQLLTRSGWVVERQVCFHGPRAIVWSLAARISLALRQPAWSDRCLLAMRSAYQDPAWCWILSPLVLITVRRMTS